MIYSVFIFYKCLLRYRILNYIIMARTPANCEDVFFFLEESLCNYLFYLSDLLLLPARSIYFIHHNFLSLDTLWAIKTQFSGGGRFIVVIRIETIMISLLLSIIYFSISISCIASLTCFNQYYQALL